MHGGGALPEKLMRAAGGTEYHPQLWYSCFGMSGCFPSQKGWGRAASSARGRASSHRWEDAQSHGNLLGSREGRKGEMMSGCSGLLKRRRLGSGS